MFIPGALKPIEWIDFTESKSQAFDILFSQVLRALDTDKEHVRSHTKWLQRSMAWENAKREESFLLSGAEYYMAKEWLDHGVVESKKPSPTTSQQDFIDSSEGYLKRAKKREKQGLIIVSSLLILSVLSLFATGIGFYQIRQKTQEIERANIELERAVTEMESIRSMALKLIDLYQAPATKRDYQKIIPLQLKFDYANQMISIRKVKRNGKYGYVDKTGQVLISHRFDQATDFFENKAWVKVNGKECFIDTAGNFVSVAGYDAVYAFDHRGYALVEFKSKFGYIDTLAEILIEPSYDLLTEFSEQRAAFQQEEKWGYIDRSGQVVIEPQFEEAGLFNGGQAEVKPFDRNLQLIDTSGTCIKYCSDTLDIATQGQPPSQPEVSNKAQRHYYFKVISIEGQVLVNGKKAELGTSIKGKDAIEVMAGSMARLVSTDKKMTDLTKGIYYADALAEGLGVKGAAYHTKATEEVISINTQEDGLQPVKTIPLSDWPEGNAKIISLELIKGKEYQLHIKSTGSLSIGVITSLIDNNKKEILASNLGKDNTPERIMTFTVGRSGVFTLKAEPTEAEVKASAVLFVMP